MWREQIEAGMFAGCWCAVGHILGRRLGPGVTVIVGDDNSKNSTFSIFISNGWANGHLWLQFFSSFD